MHAVYRDEFGQATVRYFLGSQCFGDDTDDCAAGCQCRIGKSTHEPDIAATINQPDSSFGEQSAEALGTGGIFRKVARAGAAVDAERGNRHGVLMMEWKRAYCSLFMAAFSKQLSLAAGGSSRHKEVA